MKKFIGLVTALAVLTLGGCSEDFAEVSETEITEETSDTEVTTAEISVLETEEVTETEGTAEEEKEISPEIKVTPANEVYEVYPVMITYPEKRDGGITAEKAEINEEFKKDGIVVNKFSAAYPVFSGGNKEAVQKINGYIKAYVDNIYEELRQDAENYTFGEEFSVDDFPYSMCGFLYERSVTAGDYWEYKDSSYDYDVNGNILSVYFIDREYGAGAVHGYEMPVPMSFDLRTGDKIDIGSIIADRNGFENAMLNALKLYVSHRVDYSNFEDIFLNGDDKWNDYEEAPDFLGSKSSRIIFKDGCVGYYLAPYEYGSYAEWIRRIDVAVNDILPYMNDEGKALFEGFVSAESRPANIIEYGGETYFETVEVIKISSPNFDAAVDYGDEKSVPLEIRTLSDTDYEFIGLFPDAYILELNGCRIKDFGRIAEMKNISMLGLKYCDFDGISSLLGSNITYIYGSGHNIPKEQADKFEEQGKNYCILNSVINDKYGSSWLG